MSQQTLVPDYATIKPRAPLTWRTLLNDYVALGLVLCILVVVFGILEPAFLTPRMFTIMASQVSSQIIIAVGMTFVLIIAGIDLSVGWVMIMCSAVLASCFLDAHLPLWVSIIAAIGAGLLVGLVNGLLVITWLLPSFIVTLGMLQCAEGMTHLIVREAVSVRESGIDWLESTRFAGISLTFWSAVTIVILGQLLLSYTIFGRYVVALGTNEEALRLSGVNPRPIKLAVFALCGLLVGLASIIDTSRTQCADPASGSGMELDVIAAVVIGGTSLMGGRGSVVCSFLGVLILAVVQRGLPALGVSYEHKKLVTGGIIIAAVVLDYYRHRLGSGRE